MLRRFAFVFFTLNLLAVAAFGQATSKTTTTSTQKAGAAAKNQPAATASKNPVAVIHATAGNMRCELFQDKAPKAVANFSGLAKGTKDWKDSSGTIQHNKPLYDGVIFHRVIPDFMIQGGDPGGTGAGDVGFALEDELFPDLLFDRPGRLAYANSGRNTSGSQFFITEKSRPDLNPCLKDEGCPELGRAKNTGYTIFGQCDDATVVLVKKIARRSRDEHDRPYDPVKILHIDILNVKTPGTKPPVRKAPGSKTTTQPGPATPKNSYARGIQEPPARLRMHVSKRTDHDANL
jgi:peptidyl-prolyl cis-trans isomerase A (cyclophilin A)